MRAPVYRNLDSPFRIAGFSPLELTVLCFTFAGGGELASDVGLNRGWAFALTLVSGFALYSFRRSFGDLFGARLIRFIALPGTMSARLFNRRNKSC